MKTELLRVVECFEQSLVVNEGIPSPYACDQLRFAARKADADLAALREALRAMSHAYDIGQQASEGSAIALCRAALARTERRPA